MESDGRAKCTLFIVLIPALVLPFFAAWLYFDILSAHPAARWIYTGTKLFTLVWPAAAAYFLLRARPAATALSFKQHLHALPLGALSGAVVVALGIAALWTPLGTAVIEHAGAIRQKAAELGILEHYLLFSVFLAVFHSAIEEYYWRWFVFGNLRKLLPPAAAHLIAAIAFSAHHLIVLREYFPVPLACLFTLCVMSGGVMWSFMYERQRSLAGAWLSHMLIDGGILAIGYFVIFAEPR